MRRLSVLFIAVSFITASCVGNASLWGQYATPTPLGGSVPTSTPAPAVVPSDTPACPFHLSWRRRLLPHHDPPSRLRLHPPLEVAVRGFGDHAHSHRSAPTPNPTILYYSQSGDWLPAVAKRFGVEVSEITSPKVLPQTGMLDTGTLLMIPDRRDAAAQYVPAIQMIPDNEVVLSATSLDLDVPTYVKDAGGYLSTYREYLKSTGWTSGSGVIERIAYENSVNPRLLLALLDYEARWVRGTPENKFRTDYPFGHENYHNKGMYLQLSWGSEQLDSWLLWLAERHTYRA